MDGLPGAQDQAIVEGVDPKVDVFIHGSTEVNIGRSAQSASVAVPPAEPDDGPPARIGWMPVVSAHDPTAPATVKPLSRTEVARLRKQRRGGDEAPAVDFSLFVELDPDLEPARLRDAHAEVERLANRVRWKGETATVEVSGPQVRELHAVPGVTYVEPGLPLRAPEPLVGGSEETGPPRAGLRRVTAASRRHRNGEGVLVGIIDVGGFDFAHADFTSRDGPGTRWVAIWDQGGTMRPQPAARDGARFAAFDYGAEIRQEHMDAALAAAAGRNMAPTTLEPQSVMQRASHGTHVASIAAGNRGVARRAHLAGVLVALRPEDVDVSSNFYDSTRIADAVDYLLALAAEMGGDEGPIPVSINISLGTNGHAHDSSSAMVRWIDHALTSPGRCVSVAAGNAGQVEPVGPGDRGFVTGRIHAGGRFTGTGLRHELGWVVGDGDVADISENEMEVWYSPQDRIEVEIRPPGGAWIGPIRPGRKIRNELLPNGTMLSIHSETYYPANGANRIAILLSPFFGPVEDGMQRVGPIAGGEWRVRLTGRVVRDGRYDAWIERDDARRVGGRTWRYPSSFAPGAYTTDRMVNTLACAERLLSVANVDVAHNRAHVTSSRGPTRDGRCKPDIGAEGTAVLAACGFDRDRAWIEMTGTSMASPYVCGVAALMLATAPGLTSAQIQGIMHTTSAPLAGHDFAWRNDTGFGVIDADECVNAAVEYKRGQGESRL
ncbi:MAG TPA: S8 family serine peptidase [Acidimicrobiales bacterium]